jgi:hypothetical protein
VLWAGGEDEGQGGSAGQALAAASKDATHDGDSRRRSSTSTGIDGSCGAGRE